MSDGERRAAGYREVFAFGEFRALFGAQLLSVVGDQLARVALSVLVFDRTGSAALTALTYALTFLPDLVGGPLLSGLADRYPRRRLMIITDVGRAVLVAMMAVPGTPFGALCALLVAVQLLNSPFTAARAAMMPAILEGDRYVIGSAVINMTGQAAQLLGFAAGGALVAAIGSGPVLLLDAATFAASAVLVRAGTRERRAEGVTAGKPWLASIEAGAVLVWRDRRLRALIALACVSGFYVVPEGLAVPYSDQIGGGALAAGLLLATHPLGTLLGMGMVSRWSPEIRLRRLGPMAVLSCLPLVACAWAPGLAVTATLWTLAGAASAYNLVANAAFVQRVPDASRGQAFGLALTALRVAPGLGIVLGGVAAELVDPATTVAATGALGAGYATAAGRSWRRADQVRAGRPTDPTRT